jgi:hypothetical protein
MAYPTVDKPYGLQPVNLIGGQPYAGSTRLMTIANGYGTDLFYGDVVKRVSNGTVEKDTGTSTATPTPLLSRSNLPRTGQPVRKQLTPKLMSWMILMFCSKWQRFRLAPLSLSMVLT